MPREIKMPPMVIKRQPKSLAEAFKLEDDENDGDTSAEKVSTSTKPLENQNGWSDVYTEQMKGRSTEGLVAHRDALRADAELLRRRDALVKQAKINAELLNRRDALVSKRK